GGGLPMLLFIALGFLDKRFRYSDEADGGNGMPQLLGILPTLPDRLSDPEQAAIAAHCIHQLRIMLQVNGGGADRKVFMITSASAHAGSLSPASIRKLLHESRRVFDVVIIDTGPILGSLEAAVVGAAADAVILTISRGQQQPLVERSVRQLRQIGANIAGLVFNRAEQRDFARSVGSSSIRSLSQQSVPPRLLISEGA